MLKGIIFDFDGTLTPMIRPSFKILEMSGLERGARNPKFFAEVGSRAKQNGTNIFAEMAEYILELASTAGYPRNDATVSMGANERGYNPGTIEMLQWCKDHGIKLYLVSSGLKAYLAKTEIAPFFTQIYATTFHYDDDGLITEIDRLMSSEEKAVALQEVALSLNRDAEDFSDIVYIGDGATDLDAMRHIKPRGGKSILVYLPEDSEEVREALATGAIDLQGLMNESKAIVDLCAPADYSEGSDVMNYLQELQKS